MRWATPGRKDSLFGVLFGTCLLITSGTTTAQDFVPIRDATKRFEIPGVTVLPPQGVNWFLLKVKSGEGAPKGSLLRFHKRLEHELPGGPEPDRLVYTGVFVVDTGRDFDTPTAFLEHFGEEFKGKTGQLITERQRLVSFDAQLDDSLGATCAKYRRTTEMSGLSPSPREFHTVATIGLYCMHPVWPRYAINFLYSQKHRKDKLPIELDSEVAPFLESPAFTSAQPVALSRTP